jgi:hypothetical protein
MAVTSQMQIGAKPEFRWRDINEFKPTGSKGAGL